MEQTQILPVVKQKRYSLYEILNPIAAVAGVVSASSLANRGLELRFQAAESIEGPAGHVSVSNKQPPPVSRPAAAPVAGFLQVVPFAASFAV